MDAIGRKRWAIAEGYSPSQSAFTDRTGRTPAAELCGSADVFLADRLHSHDARASHPNNNAGGNAEASRFRHLEISVS